MFKKKPVPNLSHSQQLEAVHICASTIGDVMAICSVSAKRKGEKLKKRFVIALGAGDQELLETLLVRPKKDRAVARFWSRVAGGGLGSLHRGIPGGF